ncbi:MAG: 4-hydroxy-3-methylbut-2-enyl diphosphate reductase [Candidatus Omnitrophota bacterium]|nr:4-hydroxy-3-methylbut-2-enyl diphosphate reductase [Candidatus Omnitrophota bacterium]
MKIHMAQHCGFCFGVKRAIQIAKETVNSYENVYIKGNLVHNETVCKEMAGKGIKRINSITDIPINTTLIIKAHGEPSKTYKQAEFKKLKIVDSTCPMVKDIHKKAKEIEDKGYQVIIVGDRSHEETVGILGNVKEGLVLENKKDIRRLRGKIGKKVGIVCQSTQNINNVSEVIAELVKFAEEMLFINTICQPTRLRQKEIEKLAHTCGAVIIVGSKNSANTKRLYQVAKNINKHTFWIASDKINKRKLSKYSSIGIIGGASTPPQALENISNKLK